MSSWRYVSWSAAVIKAERLGDDELADLVYSSVSARTFGRHQEVAIGHYSGRSNVQWWLASHGYAAAPDVVERLLDHAKQQDHVLSDEEIHAFLGR